jgi:hypothetical protein
MSSGFFDLKFCEDITFEGCSGFGVETFIEAQSTRGLKVYDTKVENSGRLSKLANGSDGYFDGVSARNGDAIVQMDKSSRAEVGSYFAKNVRTPFIQVDEDSASRPNLSVASRGSDDCCRETDNDPYLLNASNKTIKGWGRAYQDGWDAIKWRADTSLNRSKTN